MAYVLAVLVVSSMAFLHACRAVVAVFGPPQFPNQAELSRLIAANAMVIAIVFLVPVTRVWLRWFRDRASCRNFLPMGFEEARRRGYRVGIVFVWIGHAAAVFYLARIAAFVITDDRAGDVGGVSYWITLIAYKLGPASLLYWIGILTVEVSIRRWSKSGRPPGKSLERVREEKRAA